AIWQVKKMALFAVEEAVKDLENPNRTTQKAKPAENKSGSGKLKKWGPKKGGPKKRGPRKSIPKIE
nr:hypothetical protein [Tanacetum cinerariifolium]